MLATLNRYEFGFFGNLAYNLWVSINVKERPHYEQAFDREDGPSQSRRQPACRIRRGARHFRSCASCPANGFSSLVGPGW
jgi:hypothetical protein